MDPAEWGCVCVDDMEGYNCMMCRDLWNVMYRDSAVEAGASRHEKGGSWEIYLRVNGWTVIWRGDMFVGLNLSQHLWTKDRVAKQTVENFLAFAHFLVRASPKKRLFIGYPIWCWSTPQKKPISGFSWPGSHYIHYKLVAWLSAWLSALSW